MLLARLGAYLRQQCELYHSRLTLVQLVSRLLPFNTFNHARAVLYRWAGFDIGYARIAGKLSIWGTGEIYGRLSVGDNSYINGPAHIELNAPVRIGSNCALGHHLVLITSNHELGPANGRAGTIIPKGITIGDGAWVGACVTILPGVDVGAGAFVTAGSVVTRDVPPNARVGGNPATLTGVLDLAAPRSRSSRSSSSLLLPDPYDTLHQSGTQAYAS